MDREEWKARGLSESDVMFALSLGSILLRINSIELGLKHILDKEMGRPAPKKHDLVILWNRLTDEWKENVAEVSCVPMEDIRDALGQYKDAAVTLRYGGPLGACATGPPLPPSRPPTQTIQLPAYASRAIQVTQKIGRGETLMVTGFSDRKRQRRAFGNLRCRPATAGRRP